MNSWQRVTHMRHILSRMKVCRKRDLKLRTFPNQIRSIRLIPKILELLDEKKGRAKTSRKGQEVMCFAFLRLVARLRWEYNLSANDGKQGHPFRYCHQPL